MNPALTLCIVSLLCTGLKAQNQNYYISPPGTETLEGNSSSSIQLNQSASQVMQVDNTLQVMKSPLITGLAYRRNLNLTTSTTRTLELEIKVGHADFSKVTSTYATNYLGTPSVVFKKQNITFDWTSASPLTPAAYDAVIPFATPFIYNGKDAFVWESNNTTGNAGTGYSQDWYSGSSPATIFGPIPTPLGAGCKTPNGTMTLNSSFRSTAATSFDYGFDLIGGPASTAALLFVGVNDPNVPFFCGTLHVDPLLSAPIGSTSATGVIALRYANTPWTPALVDAAVYSQAFALDQSQASGVAMSNGLHSRAPRTPGGAHSHNIMRIFTQNVANSTSGSTPSFSSVATKYLQ
jgi:hypothetical protein